MPTKKRRPTRTSMPRRNPASIHAPSDATASDRDNLAGGGIHDGDYGDHAVFVSLPGAWGGDDVRVLEIVRGKWVVASHDRAGTSRRTFATRASAFRHVNRNMWAIENPAPKARTYAVARAQIINALRTDGWDVRENLKVPHATHPNGDFRLWFKTQAIYFTTGGRRRGQGSLSDAHSLWIGDIRAMPVAEVIADIDRSRIHETRGR